MLFGCSEDLMAPRHEAGKVSASWQRLDLLVALIPHTEVLVASRSFFFIVQEGSSCMGDFGVLLGSIPGGLH